VESVDEGLTVLEDWSWKSIELVDAGTSEEDVEAFSIDEEL
jgi:hypothetical protein